MIRYFLNIWTAVLAIVITATSLRAERPELFLMTPERLAEIKTSVLVPGTTHYETYQVMKTRADSADPFSFPASNLSYQRAYFAANAGMVYLISEDPSYATLAYEILRDAENADGDADPVNEHTTTTDKVLSAANMIGAFSVAYNYCYDGWTQAQRDWVLGRIEAGLDTLRIVSPDV